MLRGSLRDAMEAGCTLGGGPNSDQLAIGCIVV